MHRLSLGRYPAIALLLKLTAFFLLLSASPAFAQADYLYAENFGANSVSVFQILPGGSLTTLGTIAVGAGPQYLDVSPDGRFAYVGNSSGGAHSVSVIDGLTLSVVQTQATQHQPFGVAVTADGTRVLVANLSCVGAGCSPKVEVFSRNATTGLLTALATIDTLTGITLLRAPVVHPGGNLAYVIDQLGNRVLVLSLATNSVLTTINVGLQPVGATINTSGSRVYVLNASSSNVSVIDTSTNTVIATLALPGGGSALHARVTPDDRYLYVAVQNLNQIRQFDAATNTAVGAPTVVASSPTGLAITPAGDFLFTSITTPDLVAGFSINSTSGALAFLGFTPKGAGPAGLATRRFVPSSPSPSPPPGPPNVNTPVPNSGVPSPPRGVNVRRNNLALVVDFSPPAIPNVVDANDLNYRVRVYTADGYIVATQDARSSGVLIPYVKNELAYWVSVTAINGFGEGPPSDWFFVAIPDWAFYPKDRDGRPCPTPVQCQ